MANDQEQADHGVATKCDAIRALADEVSRGEGSHWELAGKVAELCYHACIPIRAYGGPINYDPRVWVERHGFDPMNCLNDAVSIVPPGWWWSAGDCSVSADASVGPDVAHCSKEMLTMFDAGIHNDIPQPAKPAQALTGAALYAWAEITRLARSAQ